MAKNKDKQNGVETEGYQDRLTKKVHGTVENMGKDDLKKYATKAVVAFVIIAVVILGVGYYKNSIQEQKFNIAAEMGKPLNDIYSQKNSEAQPKLEALVKKGIKNDIAAAKVSLLLGNVYLENRDFDKAIEQYKISASKATRKTILLKTGAEHGLATALMQKKEYDKAIVVLNEYISDYGKMTGDKVARYQKEEEQDLAPNIDDAMWKLALCYHETKNSEKAKATCEKLLKIYGDSSFATSAKKLLAVL